MNSVDLITIRGLGLGGLQLTSNELLRSRIKNYLKGIKFHIETNNPAVIANYIKLSFQQTKKQKLIFDSVKRQNIVDFFEFVRMLYKLRQIKGNLYSNLL